MHESRKNTAKADGKDSRSFLAESVGGGRGEVAAPGQAPPPGHSVILIL